MGSTAPELREEIEYRRQAIDRDLNELGDKVSPSKAAKRTAERTKQGARRRMTQTKEAVMGTTDSLKEKADDLGSSMEDSVDEARSEVRRRTVGSPLEAGLVAFGLGMVVAAVWPTSEPERRAAATLEDAAKGPAREFAREEGQIVAADLRDSAEESAHAVEDRAHEAVDNVRS